MYKKLTHIHSNYKFKKTTFKNIHLHGLTIDAFTNQLIISHRLEGSIEMTLYRYYWSSCWVAGHFQVNSG